MKAPFKQTVRQYIADGFTARESIRLAAENESPYRGAFWRGARRANAYDGNGEYPMARHFVPNTPWRGGNRWQH